MSFESKHTVPLGLELIHDAANGRTLDGRESTIIIDIIAVHGLYGHRWNSWTSVDESEINMRTMWLRDELPKCIPQSRIMTFGYRCIGVMEEFLTPAGVVDTATALLDGLRGHRQQHDYSMRPIIFIAHDFGGVIVKEAISLARSKNEYSLMANSIRRLVFFGTPHRTVHESAWESLLLDIILASSPQGIKSRLSKAISIFANFTSDLSGEFRHKASRYSIASVCGQKVDPLGTGILGEYEATLGLAFETIKHREKSHHELCTYSSYDGDKDEIRLLIVPDGNVLDSEFVSCLETLSTFTSGSNHTPYRCGAWSWLLERQEYKTWHGEVLTCAMIYVQRSSAYVNGVLLGPLLTRLREDDRTSSLLIHFSFDQQIERQGSIKSLLSSLICQILSSRPSLFSLLKSLYLLIREEAFWTDQELWLLLRILVSSRECINIVAVIDASGYSHDSQYRLLEKLAEFTKELRSNQVQSPRATFKVLLIGKVPPADTLPPILYVLSAQIGQEIDRIDLKLYVECRILDLIEKRPMLAAFAAEILAKLCDATKPPDIVLASLVLSHLQTVKLHSTMRFITGFLKKMPQSVRSFIEVPLKSLPPWASNAVSWMIYAMRPLTAKELALAIALTPHLTCLESVRDQVPLDIVADLQSIFGVLVRVDGAAVRFIHPQVKQEIMQSRAYCSSDIASHWDITELCLTYLTVDEIRNREFTDGNCETSLPQTWHFDFIEYAVKYWPTHARRAIIEPVHLERIIKCLSSKATMRKWCQLETDISYVPACRRNSLVSPLYFAAQHGLQDVVQTLLSKESVHAHDNCSQRLTLALSVRNGFHKVARLLIDHNPENLSVREDALYGACARGDIDMVKFLLTKLSLESVQASVLQKMISRAARVGFMSVIEQLVNAGAPLDTTLRLPEEKSAGREDIVSGEMPRYVTDLWPSYRSLTSKRCPLHYSAENGHHAIVRFLLKHGAPINAVDETDSTPLLLAVINGHTGTVAELYQHRQPKVDVRVPNSSGLTALHYAVQKGFADIARLLLQKNPDLEARAVDGSRPLHLATTNEREDIVNLLLLSGADINALDGKKHTALYRAAKRGSKVVTKLLMTNGADPNLEDLCGDPNPLMQAAANGLDTAVNYMLQKGANVNVADAEGYTALHHAAAHGHTEIVNELLNRGADPHRRAKYGQLPLYLAAEVGSRRTVEALLDPGADGIGLQNSSIATASQIAATAGHADTVEALLEKSANVNATDERGRNLIHLASLYCHHEVVSELLRKRLDPTAQDDLGWTPLHYAASGGSEIVVRLLLEQEDGPPDLEAKDHDGWTPFHIAAQKGHIEIMEELGQRHVNIEAQTNDGRTPLHFAYNQVNAIDWLLAHWVSIDKLDYAGKTVFTEAVENGVTASIEELLSRGLNLKLQDPQGRSYVHIAASHDQWETLKLLKQQGCDMNVMDKQKRTILHHAAVGGNLTAKNILQSDWLRECDFTVNSADQDGWTMLHWACKGLSLQAIQLMIDKGADPYQAGKENWTPYRVAVYHCREDIALYLKSIAAQLAYASGQEDSLPARYTPKSICRGCNGKPIFGAQYVCDTCWKFTFCFKCHWSHEATHPEHRFWKIEPVAEGPEKFADSENLESVDESDGGDADE